MIAQRYSNLRMKQTRSSNQLSKSLINMQGRLGFVQDQRGFGVRKSKRGDENWVLLKEDESRGKGQVKILEKNEMLSGKKSDKQNGRHGKTF
jgi:hypothetical protein